MRIISKQKRKHRDRSSDMLISFQICLPVIPYRIKWCEFDLLMKQQQNYYTDIQRV